MLSAELISLTIKMDWLFEIYHPISQDIIAKSMENPGL
jgi:hypothetical protein